MPASVPAGVLDAGVVLTRLDRRRRGHDAACALFDRSAANQIRLHISVVNLAEVLEHASGYSNATGLDPASLLSSYRIALHGPDLAVARMAARFAGSRDLSLADRFALATAHALSGRLHTTDPDVVAAARRLRIPVTRY